MHFFSVTALLPQLCSSAISPSGVRESRRDAKISRLFHPRRAVEGHRMRHFEYGRRLWANDCAINSAFAVRAAGRECKQATVPASATEKRAWQPRERFFLWEEQHYSLPFPFHLISYVP